MQSHSATPDVQTEQTLPSQSADQVDTAGRQVSPGASATFQTFRTNQRTDQSQRASAFSLVLTYLGWAGGFGGASVDLTVHFEAVGKWLFPWW